MATENDYKGFSYLIMRCSNEFRASVRGYGVEEVIGYYETELEAISIAESTIDEIVDFSEAAIA